MTALPTESQPLPRTYIVTYLIPFAGSKVFISFRCNPPIPVLKLGLQKFFPERIQNQSMSLSTHPGQNAFLVSNGSSVVLVRFPEGFEDVAAYAELLMMKSEIFSRKFQRKYCSKVGHFIPPKSLDSDLKTCFKQSSKFAKFKKIFLKSKPFSNFENFQVTFDEILAPTEDGFRSGDLSHVFLRGLESLRDLVFFVFTLTCQTSSRIAFQKLLKLVWTRFCKLIIRSPVALHDRILLSSNWIIDIVKMSEFDLENVFTNALVTLVNHSVKTLINILPNEDFERF